MSNRDIDPEHQENKARADSPRVKYRTAKERREKDKKRQQRHRDNIDKETRKNLNFTISKETALEIETIREYAREQGIPFNYEAFFTPWIRESASKIRNGRSNNSAFKELAAVILSKMPNTPGTAVFTEDEIESKFIEIYGGLVDVYPAQFADMSFTALSDLIKTAQEIMNEKAGLLD